MKCICPMGGDRTCPDNCVIASWHSLPKVKRTKKQRLPRVKELAEQGFTQDAIAQQLKVSQRQISRDLEALGIPTTLDPASNVLGREQLDTQGRTRSSGRPRRRRNTPQVEDAVASMVLDQGIPQREAAEELAAGSVQVAKTAVAREEGRREMLNQLLDKAAAKNFTEKGKLTIESAIRIHKARLDKQFEPLVNAEVRRRIDAADDATHAQNNKLRLENQALQRILGERGVFTKTQYRQMLMLCHPDNSASPQLKAELLQVLMRCERHLVKPEPQLQRAG